MSRRAAAFLREFELQPFIDLRLLNPSIYAAVDEMARLQSLRIQLNFVRAYLVTCRPQQCAADPPSLTDDTNAAAGGDDFARLRRLLWPRHYLYDTVHRYSLADLLGLSRLGDTLRHAVEMGAGHVRACRERCVPKGHICELCGRLDSVLFPFDVESTVRCDACAAVFHAECFELPPAGDEAVRRSCPRCERRKLRAANA